MKTTTRIAQSSATFAILHAVKLVGTVAPFLMVVGCAGVYSAAGNSDAIEPGVTYFLPEKAVRVSMSVAADPKTVPQATITISESDAFADVRKRYTLSYDRNWIAKNSLTVGVKPTGLLTSSRIVSTSRLSEVFKELAATTATLARAEKPRIEEPPCAPGLYVAIIRINNDALKEPKSGPCGMSITITRLWDQSVVIPDKIKQGNGPRFPGVYYRVALPYLVAVDASKYYGVIQTGLISSPTESPAMFIPIERTAFSDSSASVTLTDGMLTDYVQDADSELLGLLKLPADVVEAYFSAVGSMFTKKKETSDNEKTYLQAVQALEVQKVKTERCLAAIQAGADEQTRIQACAP